MTFADEAGAILGGRGRGRLQDGIGLSERERQALAGYLWRAGQTALVAWAAAGAYLLLMPETYVSQWTLILPGAGQTTTMSLETVGQATSNTNSPFSSVSMSPKVVYREIADSDVVRAAAAKVAGMTFHEFGRPRVKLIDETALMMFEISGPTPDAAYRKATASITALDAQLEVLRKDEVEKRSVAITQNLKGYKDQVEAARRKINEVSVASGLVSTNQFNEIVMSLGTMQRRFTELVAETGRMEQELSRLVERMGLDPAYASVALRLAGDAAMSKVVSDFADANALYTAESQHLGPNNPVLIGYDKRRIAAIETLKRLMAKLNIATDLSARTVVMLMNVSHQAELLQQLVRSEASLQGKRQEIVTIKAEKDRLDAEVTKLSGPAAKLEDLRKDHLLAEAVYSSALARVDTSKSELYGAYPIIQVLAPPTKPESRDQPSRSYAIAAGVAGTLFSLLAWGLAWLHQLQTTRRRKKPSRIG